MFGLAIAATPGRWGGRGVFVVALGLAMVTMAVVAGIVVGPEKAHPDAVFAAACLAFLGYPLGGAAWLSRWRRRHPGETGYLRQAVQACCGSLLGIVAGVVVGLVWMLVAIQFFGYALWRAN
jgi:hypothetical protein